MTAAQICAPLLLLHFLLAGAPLVAPPAGRETTSTIALVDDRGEPVTSPVTACFVVELSSDCKTAENGSVTAPPRFTSLRVEGEQHGPAAVRREEFLRQGPGAWTLLLPRKARLAVRGEQGSRITATLYPADSPDFRRPALRAEIEPGRDLLVPAARHLVSLTSGGGAPDLHLVEALPAQRYRLDHRSRPGWSAVVRVRSEPVQQLVAGAAVELSGSEGYSSSPGPARTRAGVDGLALISGLQHLVAEGVITQTGYLPARVPALSASPGTFTFREALLERGGTVVVEVTEAGNAVAGAVCEVLAYEAIPVGPAPEPARQHEARTDTRGRCRSGSLPPGPYTLRVVPPGSSSRVDRALVVRNGEETHVQLALTTVRVSGEVRRGSEPAEGFRVTFSQIEEIKPGQTARDAAAAATVDAEGRYETTLWTPGDYFVMAESPSGTPADGKRLYLAAAEEVVDFLLAARGIEGVVVDEEGTPVEGVSLGLRWDGRSLAIGRSDSQGAFHFPVPGEGFGTVEALKAGYRSPEPLTVQVTEGASPAPVVVTLRKAQTVRGRLVSGSGLPVPGAFLESRPAQFVAGTRPLVGTATSGPDGGFELPLSAGIARVFATGAGCPLTAFELRPENTEPTLPCPEAPAALVIEVRDPDGLAVAGQGVVLRSGGAVIPHSVLAAHLARLGLPAASDGSGRLYLVGLAPGAYEVFLADETSEEALAFGLPSGLLSSVQLAPLSTTELAATIERRR